MKAVSRATEETTTRLIEQKLMQPWKQNLSIWATQHLLNHGNTTPTMEMQHPSGTQQCNAIIFSSKLSSCFLFHSTFYTISLLSSCSATENTQLLQQVASLLQHLSSRVSGPDRDFSLSPSVTAFVKFKLMQCCHWTVRLSTATNSQHTKTQRVLTVTLSAPDWTAPENVLFRAHLYSETLAVKSCWKLKSDLGSVSHIKTWDSG